jgi:hypothetical protein
MNEFNIYCDESCHLENDSQKAMILGAVWCLKDDKYFLFERIKDIKKKHKLDSNFEIKWNKISSSKILFYKEIVHFFFDNDKLHFRGLIIPDKSELNHEKYKQTHDEFYYKMYFDLLKIIVTPKRKYNIYLDLKDTQGYDKVNALREVISNQNYDFSKSLINRIQEVRSEEVSLIQITDLFIGALSYINRELNTSPSKLEIIELIKKRSGYSLVRSTLPSENKFNIFVWRPNYNS